MFSRNWIWGGVFLRLVSEYYKIIVGLDISEKNIEFSKNEFSIEKIKNIEFIKYNLMDSYSLVEEYEVIALIHGLEHFSNDDYPIIFKNIRKMLKQGGYFIGALPYELPMTYRICPNCYFKHEIDGHLTKHNLESLSKLAAINNFEIIHLNKFSKYYTEYSKGKLVYFLKKIYSIINKKYDAHNQIEFIFKLKD